MPFNVDEEQIRSQLLALANRQPIQAKVSNENNWIDQAAIEVALGGGVPNKDRLNVTAAAPPPGTLMQAGTGLQPGVSPPRQPIRLPPINVPAQQSDDMHGINYYRDPGPDKEHTPFKDLFKAIILAEMKEPK